MPDLKSNKGLYLIIGLLGFFAVGLLCVIAFLLILISTRQPLQGNPNPSIILNNPNPLNNNQPAPIPPPSAQNPPPALQPAPSMLDQELSLDLQPGPTDDNGKPYISFDYTDNVQMHSNHYLLSQDQISNFPILSSFINSAMNGQKFIVEGNYTQKAGAAAGNYYYILTTDVKIHAIVKYIGNNIVQGKYTFQTCSNNPPPCLDFDIDKTLADQSAPGISNLNINDEVAISGTTSSGGGAAGTQHINITGNFDILFH